MTMTDDRPSNAECAALIVAAINSLPALIACVRAADAMYKAGNDDAEFAAMCAYDTARAALATARNGGGNG